MSEYCEDGSAVNVEGCFCSLHDIQEFVSVICSYNCRICHFSCNNAADIRSHIIESHLRRLSNTKGVVFSSEANCDSNDVSQCTTIIQMPGSELISSAASDELHVRDSVRVVSKEFSTISQSGCDFLTSTVVTHSADAVSLQPSVHGTAAGQTLQQFFVSSQEIPLSLPNCLSGDALQEVAAAAGLYVDGSNMVQPADIVHAVGPVASHSGIVQSIASGEQITEMYICDTCGTVFNGTGIVDHMLQVHGIHLDSVNVTGSHAVLTVSNNQLPPSSLCSRSIEIAMPPNTASVGTQAQLAKKPGRKRKVNVDASAAAVLNKKHSETGVQKDSEAAAATVKTLGIERVMDASAADGLSKRRIQPPRALVEDYHVLRLRQSKPRLRTSVSRVQKLLCSVVGCEATFQQQDQVDYHIRCHSEGGQFCCPECCGSFSDWCSLHPHLWTAHNIDLYAYKCSRCQFRDVHLSAATERSVYEHGMAKPKDPFVCSVCGQTFRKASMRNQHEKLHQSHSVFSSSKTFRRCICELCKRSFANRKSLNKHIEVNIVL